MGKCFSCGNPTGGTEYFFTCPTCENVKETHKIREEIFENVERLADIQERGFNRLAETNENGFEDVVSELETLSGIAEWGFSEVIWEQKKQASILEDIDKTLKTPIETQANELRIMAEKLRSRGSFDESETRFIKSIELNPLDYRVYMGLAFLYLKRNNFIEARTMFEKSLPHGNKELKSDSYRLIGRTYFCEENYNNAANALKKAVELFPQNPYNHYDYAQYTALIGNTETSLKSLETAIINKPLIYNLSLNERNFSLIKNEVQHLLDEIFAAAELFAKNKLLESKRRIKLAKATLSKAENLNYKSNNGEEDYNRALNFLHMAENSISMNNYQSMLDTIEFLSSACDWSNKAINNAKGMIEQAEAEEARIIAEEEARIVAKKQRLANVFSKIGNVCFLLCFILVVIFYLPLILGNPPQEARETIIILIILVFSLIIGIISKIAQGFFKPR
jgi:tetratricopeptide (TPR) repeat protein